MFDFLKQKIYNTRFYIPYDRLKTNRLRTEIMEEQKQSAVDFPYQKYKTSDTLFVLGSGLSVMDLKKEDWENISKHDSFGFNGWVFHDFTPTFYGIEPMGNERVFNWYIKALQQKSTEYKNMPVFVQYQHLKMRNKHFNYEGVHQENLYYNAPFMPNTTNSRVLRNYVTNFAKTKHTDFSEVFHYAGSLSYVLTMGYIMGYKKMVLLGVDLNDSRYFYSHEDAGVLAKQFNEFQLNRPKQEKWDLKATHNTLSKSRTKSYGCLPISYFIENLRDIVKDQGVEIMIGSKKSALYPMLDFYSI